MGMKKYMVMGWAFVAVVVLVLRGDSRDLERGAGMPVAGTVAAMSSSNADAGLLYGRVTTDDGVVYQGRLRWGGDEEALWTNYFNGFKADNPWVALAPSDQLPTEGGFEVFGIEIGFWKRPIDLGRPFMARFGDIARIEPRGRDLRVVLKSGTTFHLDRYAADDVADGLRVWDESRGVVDIGEWNIRTIELLDLPELDSFGLDSGPMPLYGTVRTRQGDFSGLIQWDREACLTSDELAGRSADGNISLRFENIRSIVRSASDGILATLVDGTEVAVSDTRAAGDGNRGIYVDDSRYGRVLISWDAFERLDFSPGGTGPSYGEFGPGRPLAGTVTTRSGRRLSGRLVYDLDESETTETLDAPSLGVDYTIPFERIASVMLPRPAERGGQPARIVLRTGEELRLDLAGDLGDRNGGMLVFSAGREHPEYVAWSDVQRIDFDNSAEAQLQESPR